MPIRRINSLPVSPALVSYSCVCPCRPAVDPSVPAVQVQLQSFSPSAKGRDADRYGIFGQQLSHASASSSLLDDKENLPEVSEPPGPVWTPVHQRTLIKLATSAPLICPAVQLCLMLKLCGRSVGVGPSLGTPGRCFV